MSEVLSTSILVTFGLILCRRYDPSINLDWMYVCCHIMMFAFLICSFMGLQSAIIQQLHWTVMLNQHNNRSAYGHFLKKYLPTIPLYPNKVSKTIPYFPAHKTHFFFPQKMWSKFDLRLMRWGEVLFPNF